MKKFWIVLPTILALAFFSGCQAKESTGVSAYAGHISKAQEIAIVSSATSEVMEIITDKEDIADFVSALDLDAWELKMLPDEAAEIGAFVLSQEETIRLGQTAADGTRYAIATITLYDNAFLSFEIGGLDTAFKIPPSTADSLQEYFA